MAVPLITGVLLLALILVIKINDGNRLQAKRDVDLLLTQLADQEIWTVSEVDPAEDRLLLASTAGQALLQARPWYPERRTAIDSTLSNLAAWATNTTRFPEWRRRSSWDERVFFVAHAGAVLAHHALATGSDTYATEIAWVGAQLGERLSRGKYKHLISRPDEPFFRPADNAAAIYTLSRYDQLTGEGDFATTFQDWNTYLSEELYYAESRLPCAAFSATNTCQLEPSAAVTGLYIAYRAAAQTGEPDTDIPYREWLHYFKGKLNTPFTLHIRRDMRKDQQTRFCDLGAQPLQCGRYEEEIGLWAAAEYGGGYTYFRLFAGVLFDHWLRAPVNYARLSPNKRVEALQVVAFRGLGETL